jgi:ribosomal-protein-alanine N-acetyltransferase
VSPRPIQFPVEGLTDGTVRLRLMSDDDVDAVAEACRDPEIARFTTIPSPYRPRHAREWLVHSRGGLESGTDLHTLIVDPADDELLGSAGISGLDLATGRCAFGYWVTAQARGRGVATRALRLLSRFAFHDLEVQRVELWIDPENAASLRVAERVGFSREGLLRSFMPINGVRRDMLMYSLLPGDVR